MPQISLGVRELLSVLYGPRHLSRGPIHPALLQQGITGHKDATQDRPPEYRREVGVQYTYHQDSWSLRVRGRIDGFMDVGDYILVEEIKTTYVDDFSQLDPEHNQFYIAQLTLYAWIIAQENPGTEVRARLTWWHVGDKLDRSIDLTQEQIDSGGSLLSQLAQEFISQEELREEWLARRNQSLETVDFPFPDYRPGQRELVATTTLALEQKQDLMVEAATGIGKTVGVLYPALTWLNTAPREAKVFFLTAKTSGRAIVLETLKRLPDLELRAVFIEAKERSCTHPEGDCDNCELAQDFYPKTQKIMPKLLENKVLTAQVIYQEAESHGICPFELNLEVANHGDLVIADYNYAFDPMVQLQRFFGRGSQIPSVLLIDEAHNLVGRGRSMFSAD